MFGGEKELVLMGCTDASFQTDTDDSKSEVVAYFEEQENFERIPSLEDKNIWRGDRTERFWILWAISSDIVVSVYDIEDYYTEKPHASIYAICQQANTIVVIVTHDEKSIQ